jgi:FkbM family methyltransferase
MNLLKILTSRTERRTEKRRRFYAQFLGPNDLFFDVGANMGNRIVPALRVGARVVAVEPQEECVRFLEESFGDSITIVSKALGEKAQVKKLYVSETSTLATFSQDWVNSVRASGRFRDFHWEESGEIEMTTMDAVIEEYGRPRFVKIDVEGYELEVLSGLSAPVSTVSFEYAVPEDLEKIHGCLNKLKSLDSGYRCNYSIGESMKWASRTWRSADEMSTYVSTQEFLSTDFGDIYVSSDQAVIT